MKQELIDQLIADASREILMTMDYGDYDDDGKGWAYDKGFQDGCTYHAREILENLGVKY